MQPGVTGLLGESYRVSPGSHGARGLLAASDPAEAARTLPPLLGGRGAGRGGAELPGGAGPSPARAASRGAERLPPPTPHPAPSRRGARFNKVEKELEPGGQTAAPCAGWERSGHRDARRPAGGFTGAITPGSGRPGRPGAAGELGKDREARDWPPPPHGSARGRGGDGVAR